MIIPFDKLPTLRPQVHLCTVDEPWDRERKLALNEEVCHPDATLWDRDLNIYRCPNCRGYFKQEQPK